MFLFKRKKNRNEEIDIVIKTSFKEDINSLKLLVIHNRRTEGMITPYKYPVRTCFVAFNDVMKKGIMTLEDQGSRIRIQIKSGENTNEKFDYIYESKDWSGYCKYNESVTSMVKLCDAVESWSFVISNTDICLENYMKGYEKIDDYYRKISDYQKHLEKQEELKKRIPPVQITFNNHEHKAPPMPDMPKPPIPPSINKSTEPI